VKNWAQEKPEEDEDEVVRDAFPFEEVIANESQADYDACEDEDEMDQAVSTFKFSCVPIKRFLCYLKKT